MANFTFSPKYPVVNETIIFNATYSFDFNGSIVSYLWDFGDGNITEVFKSVVNHTYAEAGTYKVTLIVTDDDGLTDTFEQLISVYTSVPLHDVVVVEVNLTSTWAYRGNIVNITITVANLGESIEKFNVTIYYNETEIEIYPVEYLAAGANLTFTIIWNTSQVSPGIYVISAAATVVPLEVETENNILVDGTVTVVFINLNGDGKVNIRDIAMVAVRFGEYLD